MGGKVALVEAAASFCAHGFELEAALWSAVMALMAEASQDRGWPIFRSMPWLLKVS